MFLFLYFYLYRYMSIFYIEVLSYEQNIQVLSQDAKLISNKHERFYNLCVCQFYAVLAILQFYVVQFYSAQLKVVQFRHFNFMQLNFM